MITNNFNEQLNIYKNLIPLNSTINWNDLYNTPFGSLFNEMEKTPQNTAYHGEGNVLSHVKLVCENLVNLDEYKKASYTDKFILFTSALLHDVGKIKRTKIDEDSIVSSGHSFYGSITTREFLYKNLNLAGDVETQNLRESICLLTKYHSFPPYSITDTNALYKCIKTSCNGELVSGFSCKNLYILEKADVLGRIANDTKTQLEKLEYFKILCEDNNCFTTPFKFSSPYTKRAYFLNKTSWQNDDIFDGSFGNVILTSGLPGVGKDTYIQQNLPNLPIVSLDNIREKLKIKPTDNQSPVVAYAQEEAKEFLRKKQPFIWNATNITYDLRCKPISLFERYGASVSILYLETSFNENIKRNAEREKSVPLPVIEKMLSKLEVPENFEAKQVKWIIN